MKTLPTSIKTIAVVCVALASFASFAHADTYSTTNFQSDIPGVAAHTDPHLVNPWGMTANSTGSVIWVSDNGNGVSTLYRQDGTALSLVVTIPPSAKNKDGGNPTGIVLNTTAFFKVTKNGNSQPAKFIFASEDGSISGWNSSVDPTNAVIAVDNSKNKAVYKGAATGVANGHNFLYVTNFFSGHVETYDENFQQTNPNGFSDPNLPAGFAPFGIQNLNRQIYVTYALQGKKKHDDVAGPGNGFVNVFDTSGNLLRRVASKGTLNSPWGLALAPADFGKFSGDLLVGNFGDGRIHAYDPRLNERGEFQHRGPLHSTQGRPIEIEGLWGLAFGNGANAGPSNTLFFTAGPFDEQHGLFGALVVAEPPGHDR